MSLLSPNLEDVSISWSFLFSIEKRFFEPLHFKAALRLATYLASSQVWTDTPPNLRGCQYSEISFQRVSGLTKKRWPEFWAVFREMLVVEDGEKPFVRLPDDAVVISRGARTSVPTDVKTAVVGRDGMRCVYCGDMKGPFHFDHIYPYSKGGEHLPNNMVVACRSCNLAKSDMTLREWVYG